MFARKQVEHELEEHAIEAMEVVFAQPLGVLACLYALISTTKVNFLLLVHKHTTFPMSKSSVLQTNAYTVFLHAHVGATEQGESDNCVEIGDSDSSPQKVNHRWHPLCWLPYSSSNTFPSPHLTPDHQPLPNIICT